MKFEMKKIIVMSFSLLTISAYADNSYVLVAPNCLLKNTAASYQAISQSKDFALIQTDDKGLDEFMQAKRYNTSNCGGFVNVTSSWQAQQDKPSLAENDSKAFLKQYLPKKYEMHSLAATPIPISYGKQVQQLLNTLNPQNMWDNLTSLTQFNDRYASSSTGIQTAAWIRSQIENKIGGRNDVSISYVNTESYPQPSLVVKIGNSTNPGVVIGAHMDTLRANPNAMPGADDDGTGVVTLLETARVMLSSNMRFKNPIYLVFYSAEEVGLVGSQRVVASFKRQNIPVSGVMQIDMTGYAPNKNLPIWFINDYTDPTLTEFMSNLVKTYVNRPVRYTQCGYACSDHATWTQNGYKAAFPAETAFKNSNPNIHSPQDKMSNISLVHMTDYAKLAVAFATELAQPLV